MYFGVHNHDEYSNITAGLDSINKLDSLIEKAKKLGMNGLAITNHDNLCEVIEINRKQKELRKKNDPFTLAIGNEIYLVDHFFPQDSVTQKYYHFILVAKDKTGYDALIELSTRAWYRSEIKRGRRRVPTLKSDVEEVMKWAKGHVVAATACIGGEFAQLILESRYDDADKFYKWCVEQFGIKDFYIELQPSRSEDQIKFNQYVYENYDQQPCIITTDAHYQDEEEYPLLEALLRSAQENREVKEYYEYARLMSEDEIYKLMEEAGLDKMFIRQCLDNTMDIKKQIQFFDLARKPRIPSAPLPEIELLDLGSTRKVIDSKYPTLSWALKEKDKYTHYAIVNCLNSLIQRNKMNDTYLSRLEEEFDTFKFQSESFDDNFFKYFTTMQHYLDLAWSIDCAVGPSRGSASGSLICYLMDIVQCDPLQYNLPFWRFANKVRTSPLDIDTDFQPSKRADLFKAIREERGELGLTQVATYRTLTLKAAIGNAGRGYRSKDFPNGLDSDITTFLSSLIEIRRGFVATLKQTLHGDPITGYKRNDSFIKECRTYPGLLEIIAKFEGLVVGSGTHAAAVILFDDHDRLIDHCSLMRAPNGDLCTALDLHTIEETGAYKYDFLLLSTLDIQATCFKLLQKDRVIDPNLTLKQCFRQYINPNNIDFDNPEIWEKLYNNEVLSIFQWDAASGRKGILMTHPHTLMELTAVNGLIRLMTQEGEEDQLERFCRIKENPQSFEDEMRAVGCSEEQRKYMHDMLDQFNGCAATQESFMVLSQQLAHYSLKQADALRKTVAKKKMEEISKQKELFYSQCDGTEEVKDYLWKVVIAPSLGYGFSLNHALPYSIIGVQCVLLGGVLFPKIYWQAACLLQRSGALDDKSPDYNKIAKAVAAIRGQGVNIQPVDINLSGKNFEVDAENETIHYGLSGIKGLRDNVVQKILEMRPFSSFLDFAAGTHADIGSVIALVKAGAFLRFEPREKTIQTLMKWKSDTKERLNGQNLMKIAEYGCWPTMSPELELSLRVFNFTRYLKMTPNGKLWMAGWDTKEYYVVDERAREFLENLGCAHLLEGEDFLSKSVWKPIYDSYLQPIKDYLKTHQEEVLEEFNKKIQEEWREKYFPVRQSPAQGEIETMGICFEEHPYAKMAHLMADFSTLPQQPEVQQLLKIKGRTIPKYRLTMIAGIVIAKDKQHSSITLLTPTGAVEVKFRKEQFAIYDAQISTKQGGRKKVLEKSWLNRGNGLIIHGMRQDDQFIAKTYKDSPMVHTAYKITGFKEEEEKFDVQKTRMKGKVEENDES